MRTQECVHGISFLDWQIIRYASPATDLVYNLFTVTDKAMRDSDYDNFIKIYHESLSKTVRLLGSNPDELFSFDDLQNELKKVGVYALLMAPMLLQLQNADQSKIVDQKEMFDKIEEGDNRPELITGLNDEGQGKYEERWQDVIDDILKFGYFRKIEPSK